VTSVDIFGIKEKVVAILKADTNLYTSTPSDKTKIRKIEAGAPTPKSMNEPPLPRIWVTNDNLIANAKELATVQSNAKLGEEYDIRIKIILVVEAKDGPKTEEDLDDFTKLIIEQLDTNYDLRTPGGAESTRVAEASHVSQITELQPPLVGDSVKGRVIRLNVIVRA